MTVDAALQPMDGSNDGSDDPSPDAPTPPSDGPEAKRTRVYLVRHAETSGTATDRPLSAAGMARAQDLAELLADAHIVAVYTSQYTRTQQTGTPTATAAGVTLVPVRVDGANEDTYAEELATMAETHNGIGDVLIVGHSNTVPDTVEALGGTDIEPIAETEFDRIYTITLDPAGNEVVEGRY